MSRLFLKSCAMLAVSAEGVTIAMQNPSTASTNNMAAASDVFTKLVHGHQKCNQVDTKVFNLACGSCKHPTDVTITEKDSEKARNRHRAALAKFSDNQRPGDPKDTEQMTKIFEDMNTEIVQAACCPDYKGTCCSC
ncbi:unnamed protein product [Amoebophrya sp. A25]|nr:unnamed protein product [Amoebophrya sp. A25]|eukprot:GSA25T00022967001.1